jgi:hypothetical protein
MSDEDKKEPAEHAPVKMFMNPVTALNRVAQLLGRNPRDRALRVDRDVLEGLALGFIDYANQIKELKKEESTGGSDDQAGSAPSAEPIETDDPSQ